MGGRGGGNEDHEPGSEQFDHGQSILHNWVRLWNEDPEASMRKPGSNGR